MKIKWSLEALGTSLLLLFPLYGPLLLPDHLALYHHHLGFRTIVGGILLDIVGVAALGTIALGFSLRLHPRVRYFVGVGLSGILAWRAAALAEWLLQQSISTGLQEHRRAILWELLAAWPHLRHFPRYLILFGVLSILEILALVFPSTACYLVRASRTLALAFGCCAVWVIPELLYIGFVLHDIPAFDISQRQPPPKTGGRIIWVLFDGLSYNLVFDHPPVARSFPQFHRLRSESVSFGNLRPIGMFTERIVPSILFGRQMDKIASTWNGDLLAPSPHTSEWTREDGSTSLFRDARDAGWNPAVAGWYNPYCRLFSNLLTACSWTYHELAVEVLGASQYNFAIQNALVVPQHLISWTESSSVDKNNGVIVQRIAEYGSIMHDAKALIRNERLHFLFIHLPVPHPPGIFDRQTHRLCVCGNYLDNLTLADDTLGTLRAEIDKTSLASQTILIVSSDHSWRVPMWRFAPGWSKEEERVSHGIFDDRPVFIVHFPQENVGYQVDAKVSEMIEHEIVSSLLHGSIDGPPSIARLAQSATEVH